MCQLEASGSKVQEPTAPSPPCLDLIRQALVRCRGMLPLPHDHRRHLRGRGIAGLNYIALGVGLTGASQVNTRMLDGIYKYFTKRNGGACTSTHICVHRFANIQSASNSNCTV